MEHDAIITEAVFLQKVIKEVIKYSKAGGMFRGANHCTVELSFAFDAFAYNIYEFQQCGMCDQQRLRPAYPYAQSDQSLC